jgi:antitoxin (DNA-binding transcriptional repressor) of toxin-antitoxin stability system
LLDQVTTSDYHENMKAVGIKVLKAKLSEYVRLAKTGEVILVTERDEVVAELRPARRQPLPSGELDELLDDLADKGEVTLPSREVAGWSGPKAFGKREQVVTQALLDELRRE